MKIWMTIALVALTVPALAQDTLTKSDREPEHELTREEKNAALKAAYLLNGGVMNGPMVDLTDAKTIAAYNRLVMPGSALPMPRSVQTVPVAVDPPPVKVAEVAPAPRPKADICQRHGKRKVTTRGGRSWRCR